jgi:hypothetical protein
MVVCELLALAVVLSVPVVARAAIPHEIAVNALSLTALTLWTKPV